MCGMDESMFSGIPVNKLVCVATPKVDLPVEIIWAVTISTIAKYNAFIQLYVAELLANWIL